MSTTDRCSCDEAARWKRRALRAELSLEFARRQLEGILGVLPVSGAASLSAAGDGDDSGSQRIGTTEGATE
jgi:hypothetical protein